MLHTWDPYAPPPSEGCCKFATAKTSNHLPVNAFAQIKSGIFQASAALNVENNLRKRAHEPRVSAKRTYLNGSDAARSRNLNYPRLHV